jgi:hypothetical protein
MHLELKCFRLMNGCLLNPLEFEEIEVEEFKRLWESVAPIVKTVLLLTGDVCHVAGPWDSRLTEAGLVKQPSFLGARYARFDDMTVSHTWIGSRVAIEIPYK